MPEAWWPVVTHKVPGDTGWLSATAKALKESYCSPRSSCGTHWPSVVNLDSHRACLQVRSFLGNSAFTGCNLEMLTWRRLEPDLINYFCYTPTPASDLSAVDSDDLLPEYCLLILMTNLKDCSHDSLYNYSTNSLDNWGLWSWLTISWRLGPWLTEA